VNVLWYNKVFNFNNCKEESKVACDVLMHCLLNPMQNHAICLNQFNLAKYKIVFYEGKIITYMFFFWVAKAWTILGQLSFFLIGAPHFGTNKVTQMEYTHISQNQSHPQCKNPNPKKWKLNHSIQLHMLFMPWTPIKWKMTRGSHSLG